MNVFDGLLGYEKLMLVCGFILFVFALAAITVMIVQRRDFKMAMALIVLAIVLMGFPGIQAVKFSQDTVELDRIRTQPQAPADPAQKQQAEQALANLEQRAVGNPQLQAQVSDGYRAIGEVDKAYDLAKSVLREKPSAQVQATLVPVLTAKLNQVQAGARITAPPAAATSAPASGSMPPAVATGAPAGTASAASATPTPVAREREREIAAIASQLQSTAAPLPAASHAALAKAYVVLGQPQRAQANVDAARRIDPNIRISAAVLRAARAGGNP
jgi:tetratricopeptide (TPR) repeat protein